MMLETHLVVTTGREPGSCQVFYGTKKQPHENHPISKARGAEVEKLHSA